jgi:5-oxopent-3-ene-1,2,5-tricarboxylate decarboxylase / 2-hydroxyhepta-2,4-diene-1,7-dioate isomerase
MKRARVRHQGVVFDATPIDTAANTRLQLSNGLVVEQNQIEWLLPVAPCADRARTILCLGLNYSDHARELAFKPPTEPLVFLKGQSALVAHKAQTPRPADVQFMHYECELAVVIGKTASKVAAPNAYDYVAGYTIANDFAIRDYLENWYRPNLKVKGRPGCTVLGPWLTDATDIVDPMNLALSTYVNGQQTQSGHTRDMIFDVPFLIEYFTAFMTLQPGDLILTGTPDGIVDCPVGALVQTSIEGLGTLETTMIHE